MIEINYYNIIMRCKKKVCVGHIDDPFRGHRDGTDLHLFQFMTEKKQQDNHEEDSSLHHCTGGLFNYIVQGATFSESPGPQT